MNRQIRRGTFETNSSSTHSVSIYKGSELSYSDIPTDGQIILNDGYASGTDIYDEVGKLNYIVTMIASILKEKIDDEEIDERYEDFDTITTYKYFVWLKELIKKERNTEVVYEKPNRPYFPYYDTTYDNHNSIYTIFSDDGKYLLDDEMQFKQRCKEIIFDKEIIIENKENEY